MAGDQHEIAVQVGETMFANDRATREFMQIELVSCQPGHAVMLQGRHGVHDMTVRNQQGEVVALFRGKSTQIKGHVLPEPT